MVHSSLLEITEGFRVMRPLALVESRRLLQHGAQVGCRILALEIGEALAKRQMPRELDKANQIATLTATMAVKEILAGVDIEGRPSLGVQGAESHQLGALTRWPADPILLSQVIEQRKSLFELFEILAHGAVLASGDEPKRKGAAFPGKDGGENRKIIQRRRGQRTCRTGVSPDNSSAWESAGA